MGGPIFTPLLYNRDRYKPAQRSPSDVSGVFIGRRGNRFPPHNVFLETILHPEGIYYYVHIVFVTHKGFFFRRGVDNNNFTMKITDELR